MGARPSRGRFADLPLEHLYEGVRQRSFDSERATVTEYVFGPHARFPIHRHRQEQITLIQEGDVELTAAGETMRLAAGDWSIVGPSVEHGIRAGEQGARFLAIVVPRRDRSAPYTVLG
jgi:quercetin dioxygenase-like cupin family protein